MPIVHELNADIMNSQLQTLVCPVNTVGVMGKGLALDMAKRFRGLLYRYRLACKSGALNIDSLWIYTVNDNRKILCFPTKEDWRFPSKLEWIDANLKRLAEEYVELGITSIAIPRLGCGLGGLNWEADVRPLVYKRLGKLPIPITVYGP